VQLACGSTRGLEAKFVQYLFHRDVMAEHVEVNTRHDHFLSLRLRKLAGRSRSTFPPRSQRLVSRARANASGKCPLLRQNWPGGGHGENSRPRVAF
jgi:hypothetical protein